MRFKKYINEKDNNKVDQIKRELKELKSRKLTPAGKKKIEKLEDQLTRMGIFNF